VFGVALGLMIATHARLQRALPARIKRVRTPPHLRPAAMPELPGRIQPGMGRADLATALGMSHAATTAPGSSPFGALVSRAPSTQRSNRPKLAR
jgi:hypothetical protein